MKDRQTTRNSSAVVGVRLVGATRRKGDAVYPDWRWVAFWPGCPNSGGVGWSVNKYGGEPACLLAYLARKGESADRAQIEVACLKQQNTAEYRRILRLKQLPRPEAALASEALDCWRWAHDLRRRED